jgi:hypothetical protein
MDDRRFDALTKALAATKPSRREALRRLAGGALATVFGGVALEEVSAQDVGIEAYNLVCKQEGAKFFCTEGTPANEVTTCKSLASGCVCARKKGGGQVCVQQPSTGCPTKRNKCRDAGDCDSGETCILVSGCCDGSNRGKCVQKCPE